MGEFWFPGPTVEVATRLDWIPPHSTYPIADAYWAWPSRSSVRRSGSSVATRRAHESFLT